MNTPTAICPAAQPGIQNGAQEAIIADGTLITDGTSIACEPLPQRKRLTCNPFVFHFTLSRKRLGATEKLCKRTKPSHHSGSGHTKMRPAHRLTSQFAEALDLILIKQALPNRNFIDPAIKIPAGSCAVAADHQSPKFRCWTFDGQGMGRRQVSIEE